MNDCRKLTSHLSRIEGQINALKRIISEAQDCQDVIRLSLSVSNSFKSFKMSLLEAYLKNDLYKDTPLPESRAEDLSEILKLAKN